MLTRIQKIVAAVIFSLTVTLVLDNNIFVTTPVKLLVFEKKVEHSSGTGSRQRGGHNTLFLVDQDGNKYKVPDYIYDSHDLYDSFSVTRSFLFHKAIRFQSVKNGVYTDEKIGVINSDWFSRIISFMPVLLSFIVLFFSSMIKDEERLAVIYFLSILLAAVTVAFYFIFST